MDLGAQAPPRARDRTAPPEAPESVTKPLLERPRHERVREAEKLKREGYLITETTYPEGRPCCGRLAFNEWGVHRDDPEREAKGLPVRTPEPRYPDFATAAVVGRLYARFHGGIARKHLEAYAAEDQFLQNRAKQPHRRKLTRVLRLGLRAPPRSYRSLVATERQRRPVVLRTTVPASVRQAIAAPEPKRPRVVPGPRPEPFGF